MTKRFRISRKVGIVIAAVTLGGALAAFDQTRAGGQSAGLVRGNAPGEWRYWGADAWSTRYSPLDQINATGFGLTLGLQSRIDTVRDHVQARARVGNLYVNRNQIGAVVESQPFGGEGLSGTGPKAGGPHYVARFATERVTCIDTTAAGGNATLMASIEG